MSPEEEENPIMKKLDQVYQEQQMANKDSDGGDEKADSELGSNNVGNVASAIADMTADFCQSISMKAYDFEENPDEIFDHRSSVRQEIDDDDDYEAEMVVEKPISTVKTIQFDNNGGIFDPFETIHDEDAPSSKRSSIEVSAESSSNIIQQNIQQNEETFTKSSKAKELFNSSMASFEILAAATVASTMSATTTTTITNPDMEQISPSASGDVGLLAAPKSNDVYNSDLSDLSDVSPSDYDHVGRSALKYEGKKIFCLFFSMFLFLF